MKPSRRVVGRGVRLAEDVRRHDPRLVHGDVGERSPSGDICDRPHPVGHAQMFVGGQRSSSRNLHAQHVSTDLGEIDSAAGSDEQLLGRQLAPTGRPRRGRPPRRSGRRRGRARRRSPRRRARGSTLGSRLVPLVARRRGGEPGRGLELPGALDSGEQCRRTRRVLAWRSPTPRRVAQPPPTVSPPPHPALSLSVLPAEPSRLSVSGQTSYTADLTVPQAPPASACSAATWSGRGLEPIEHAPVSGSTSSTRLAASRSPARAATTERVCSYPVRSRNVGARP